MADQEARFAKAKKENNQRFLDISTVYDSSFLKGKRVAITGANRGLGLALATEVTAAGAELIAIVRSTSDELDALKPVEIIQGIDATDDKETAKLNEKVKGGPIDIVSWSCCCGLAGRCWPLVVWIAIAHFARWSLFSLLRRACSGWP